MMPDEGRASRSAHKRRLGPRLGISFLAFLAAASIVAIALVSSDSGARVFAVFDWLQRQAAEAPMQTLALYALVCFLSQLVIVPSGTLIALGGGYLFGLVAGGGILAISALAANVIVFLIANSAFSGLVARYADAAPQRRRALDILQSEGAAGVVALRLSPIVPSALTATLSAAAGISLATFALMSVLTIWVRPFAFAAAGSSMRQLADVAQGAPANTALLVTGLSLAAFLLFALRLYVRTREEPQPPL
jgi:uncharacterized membrane protein YdjX (TVP38/TMEM64 family)